MPDFSEHPLIKSAEGVKKLHINFSPSKYIFYGIGQYFTNLEELRIEAESLDIVEYPSLTGLTNLKKLEITNIKIKIIAEGSLWGLKNLEELLLWNCELKSLPGKLLKFATKLKKAQFQSNNVQHLGKDLFKNNLELEFISFRGNPLKKIEVDFTKLPKLTLDGLQLEHTCAVKYNVRGRPDFNGKSMRDLQNVIWQECNQEIR